MDHPNDHYYSFNGVSNDLILRLLKLPLGYHCLILYPNIETIRKIYAEYIHLMIEENNVAILFLSYYDTTDNVRSILSSKDIHVKEREKEGSMIILDIMKVIESLLFEVPDIEKLRVRKKDRATIRGQNDIHYCRYVCIQSFT